LKLAQLQQAGKNIFEALPEEERPEGSEDLAEMTPPPAEGEGAPGGGVPAGGGAPPAPAGGEAGTPAPGEEGTAPGPTPIPPDVAGQLGPAPETAEYVPMFSIDKKQNYSEALQKKNKLVTMINEMVEEQQKVILMQKEEKETTKYVRKHHVSYEELELNGEFTGLSDCFAYND